MTNIHFSLICNHLQVLLENGVQESGESSLITYEAASVSLAIGSRDISR